MSRKSIEIKKINLEGLEDFSSPKTIESFLKSKMKKKIVISFLSYIKGGLKKYRIKMFSKGKVSKIYDFILEN